MTQPVQNLDQLKKHPSGIERFQALTAYLEQGEAKLKAARALRYEDLRTLAAEHGQSGAARLAGVSLSTVKLAVGRP